MTMPTTRWRTMAAGLVALALALVGSLPLAQSAVAADTQTVSGRVTDSVTGAGIGSVLVDPGSRSTYTAADGTYTLTLVPGTYSIGFDDCSDHSLTFRSVTV